MVRTRHIELSFDPWLIDFSASVYRDTVCSVGLISRMLPFVSSNSAIRYFRHAVSLDERRAKFKANLYNRPTKEENSLGVQPGEMPKSKQKRTSVIPAAVTKWVKDTKSEIVNTLDKAQKEELEQAKFENGFDMGDTNYLETNVDEVWFAGCHCGKCLSLFEPQCIDISFRRWRGFGTE